MHGCGARTAATAASGQQWGVRHLEGQHCPEAGHLCGGCAVSGVAGKTGVAYAADGGVLIEPAGDMLVKRAEIAESPLLSRSGATR